MFLELLLWFTDEWYVVKAAAATGTAQATGLVHNFTTIVARMVPSRLHSICFVARLHTLCLQTQYNIASCQARWGHCINGRGSDGKNYVSLQKSKLHGAAEKPAVVCAAENKQQRHLHK